MEVTRGNSNIHSHKDDDDNGSEHPVKFTGTVPEIVCHLQ